MTDLSIREATAARTAQMTRRGATITLVVLHDDPRTAAAIIAAASAAGAKRAPHYVIAADGDITRLVADTRAARHSGLAVLSRRRDIDKISIGIMLAAPGDTPEQQQALAALLALLGERHGLMADAALMRWQAPVGDSRLGTLLPVEPVTLPPPPGSALLAEARSLAEIEADPAAAVRLWIWLTDLAYKRRGNGFNAGGAFHLHAAKHTMGAALAKSSELTQWLSVGGKTYNYQHFARDTAFNEGENWAGVQSLSALLAGGIPAPGTVEFALLESSYAAALAGGAATSGVTGFKPSWATHQRAASLRLGPALSGAYRITVEGAVYSLQVFAADTLYIPVANPEARIDWSDIRRLSETAAGALANALWAESYNPGAAPFDARAPFHQEAVAGKLGAPLGPPAQAGFEGTIIEVQVFALDTLYCAPGEAVRRTSALPQPAAVANWVPKAATPPAPPAPRANVAATPANLAAVPIPAGDRTSAVWPPATIKPVFDTAARQKLFGVFEFTPDPVASNPERIRILGTWQQDTIVPVVLPQLIKRGIGPKNGTILFHRLAAAQLQRCWALWEQAGLLDRIQSFDGTFNARFIRGSRTHLSNHAFGTAFDINARSNGLAVQPPLVGQPGSIRELVPYAQACGFYWGGHFADRLDGMHFEVAVVMP